MEGVKLDGVGAERGRPYIDISIVFGLRAVGGEAAPAVVLIGCEAAGPVG